MLTTVLATASIGLVAASPAGAAPYEPNETIAQAKGPLNGGESYSAAIENADDADYYYFNVVGQRQLDITITRAAGYCDGYLTLRNPDGEYIREASIPDPGDSSQINHLLFSSSGNSQYVLQARADTGCSYTFTINPADAVSSAAPGVVVTLNALKGADDSQRVLLDGKEVGALQGTTGPTVLNLGVLAPTARLTFEARNQSGGWSWDVKVTNHEARNLLTTFTESQSSDSDSPRTGVVRRVTMSPSGGILDTCGEALAPTICDPPLPPPDPPAAGPSAACMKARSRRAASARRVSATKRALKRARKRSTRRKLNRRLTTQRRDLSRRTSEMRSACAL